MMHFFSNFTYGTIAPCSNRIWILFVVAITALGLFLCILLERKAQQVSVAQMGG